MQSGRVLQFLQVAGVQRLRGDVALSSIVNCNHTGHPSLHDFFYGSWRIDVAPDSRVSMALAMFTAALVLGAFSWYLGNGRRRSLSEHHLSTGIEIRVSPNYLYAPSSGIKRAGPFSYALMTADGCIPVVKWLGACTISSAGGDQCVFQSVKYSDNRSANCTTFSAPTLGY